MPYEARIRQERTHMSKSFARLADYLLDSYVEAAFMTASELAHTLNLDAATVVRFSQFLDYDGFPELQDEIRDRVKDDLLRRPAQAEVEGSIPAVAANAMRELALALEHTRISLDTDSLEKLIEKIGEARRIVILAEGPAQPNAYSLVQYLEQGNFPVYIARPGIVDLARTINTATEQDLILALDITGHSTALAKSLSVAQSRGIPTAAILGAASLASARYADIIICAQSRAMGVGVVSLETIIYTLAQALRWRFSERFAGTEQAIADLSAHIQQPLE